MPSTLTSHRETKQLCFTWEDNPERTPVKGQESRRAKNRSATLAEKRPVAKARSTPRTEDVKISSTNAMRTGKPEHISDLMVAVLARYGIDPYEVIASMDSQ